MDRNQHIPVGVFIVGVALRKESVDRNTSIDNLTQGVFVALRKESVDRNLPSLQLLSISCLSLSARRAWIEIIEEVSKYVVKESLSARRAWIEMFTRSTLA